ncbi:MAG: ketol-acid reductoisomerase, partial [Chloroflexota bacterium]
MTQIYYDSDADLGMLQGKTIGILGFGNQGQGHALNLKDSGLKVVVGLRPGSSSQAQAEAIGLKAVSVEKITDEADIIAFLIPDQDQRQVYYDSVAGRLKAGKVLLFAHGFNIRFNQIVPPRNVDVIMVAPKSPGAKVRQLYTEKFGVPALLAVHHDASGKAKGIALAYAKGIGCTRAGVLETTFA